MTTAPRPPAPEVTPLPDIEVNGVAIRMQQINGISILTGLPVVWIGPVFVKPAKTKGTRS